MTFLFLAQALAILVTGVAAVIDARKGVIPNSLTLPLLGTALAAHGIFFGFRGLGFALLGAGLCGLVPFVMFQKGAMGGGDVKMFTALGALLGPHAGLEALFLSFTVGTIYGCARLAFRGELLATLGRSLKLLAGTFSSRFRGTTHETLSATMPLGPAIFVGTILAAFLRRGG